MKNKTIGIFLLLVCILCEPLAAGQETLELTVLYSHIRDAELPDNKAEGEGRHRISFLAVLRNIGSKPLAVPTGEAEWSHGYDGGSSLHIFVPYDILKSATGEPNIPSASALSLVTLRPGEVTQISYAIRTDHDVDLKDMKFVYKVTKSVSERFGTWAGRLEVRPQEATEYRKRNKR